MAEYADSTSIPSTSASQEDFDNALAEANIVNDLISHLADAAINNSIAPSASLYAWLADELKARLERIEVADMTMRRCRA